MGWEEEWRQVASDLGLSDLLFGREMHGTVDGLAVQIATSEKRRHNKDGQHYRSDYFTNLHVDFSQPLPIPGFGAVRRRNLIGRLPANSGHVCSEDRKTYWRLGADDSTLLNVWLSPRRRAGFETLLHTTKPPSIDQHGMTLQRKGLALNTTMITEVVKAAKLIEGDPSDDQQPT